jgi:hypothetical protein
VNFDGGPFLSTDLILFANLKARQFKNIIMTIVVIFYVLIYIEISKKSGILAIVDNALLDCPPSGQPQEGTEPTRWTKKTFIWILLRSQPS